MTPTKLLLQANLIQEDHKRNLKNFFIKHWELGNEISSNELNPKKGKKEPITPDRRTLIDDDMSSSLSGLTPIKTILSPV